MHDAPVFDTVDAPVFHWARHRPEAIALDDGECRLRFVELAEQVQARAEALRAMQAPAIVWTGEQGGVVQRLVDFLGIVRSGRCAAVADPDWPAAVRDQVYRALPQSPSDLTAPTALSPFYIGFTSGSTGMPKGYRRHHRSWIDSFQAGFDTFGDDLCGRVLSPGRLSHSLFLFGALMGLWTGAGARLQNVFAAQQALSALRDPLPHCLVAVPSQLLVMLARAQRRALPPLPEVRLVLISGARWMRQRTPDLRALFPNAQLVEFYGTSEMSFVTWMHADAQAHPNVVGTPFPNVEIEIRGRTGDAPEGLIYVRSPMLFLDYVGREVDPTAALRDGDWLSVRDIGYLDAEQRLRLVGREHRMVVTQGKNLFPEEVETVLTALPGVAAASVLGVEDALRGREVVAVLSVESESGLEGKAVLAWCRRHLEAFKTPRRLFLCEAWPMTTSGKTDHGLLSRAVNVLMSSTKCADDEKGLPCLKPW